MISLWLDLSAFSFQVILGEFINDYYLV